MKLSGGVCTHSHLSLCNTQNCVTRLMHHCIHLLVEHLQCADLEHGNWERSKHTRKAWPHTEMSIKHTLAFTGPWIFSQMLSIWGCTVVVMISNQFKFTVLCHTKNIFSFTHMHNAVLCAVKQVYCFTVVVFAHYCHGSALISFVSSKRCTESSVLVLSNDMNFDWMQVTSHRHAAHSAHNVIKTYECICEIVLSAQVIMWLF